MYICICKSVTEARIREAIMAGATSLEEVQRFCGAGTDCGSCVLKLYRVVREKLALGLDETDSKAV